MNKTIFTTGLIILIFAVFFVSCKKSNVTNGNKRILGTWKLVSETSTNNYESNSKHTFPENICGFEDYTSSYVRTETYTFDGTTVHHTGSKKETIDGETETKNYDTTYTNNYPFELTFMEDGTCIIKLASKPDLFYEYDDYSSTHEYSGYWNWIDSYEEKTGIRITIADYMEDGLYSDGFIELYIETLEKDELIFTFDSKDTGSYESENNYNGCSDPITGEYIYVIETYTSSGVGISNGTRTMAKQD